MTICRSGGTRARTSAVNRARAGGRRLARDRAGRLVALGGQLGLQGRQPFGPQPAASGRARSPRCGPRDRPRSARAPPVKRAARQRPGHTLQQGQPLVGVGLVGPRHRSSAGPKSSAARASLVLGRLHRGSIRAVHRGSLRQRGERKPAGKPAGRASVWARFARTSGRVTSPVTSDNRPGRERYGRRRSPDDRARSKRRAFQAPAHEGGRHQHRPAARRQHRHHLQPSARRRTAHH